MKKIIHIVLSISLLLSLNSCEWFNTTILGNPSKVEVAKKIQLENARKDSIARVEREAAALAAQQAQEEAKNKEEVTTNQRFHVMVGCFMDPSNAERMKTTLTNKGYKPKAFAFHNGFTCIAAQSFDNMSDAYNLMTEMLRYSDFCPDDVWVYDINSRLHK
jgi:hypothetical protein